MTTPTRCGAELTAAGGRGYWTCACGDRGQAGGYGNLAAAAKAWADHVVTRTAKLTELFGACEFCDAPRTPDPHDPQPPPLRRLVCTSCGEPARR